MTSATATTLAAETVFVVGDIHGCFDELRDLLDAAALPDDAHVLSLGDLVGRGPDPAGVVRFFRERRDASVVMGNHEYEHIRHLRRGGRLAFSQRIARDQLGDDYADAVAWFETFPHRVETAVATCIHGFLVPGVALAEQRPEDLLGLPSAEARFSAEHREPWYRLVDGDAPVIAGHHDYDGTQEPQIIDGKVFLVDTDCCRGGRLTGVALPEFRVVSVPARADHWSALRAAHGADFRSTEEGIC